MDGLNVTVNLSGESSGWSRVEDHPPAASVVVDPDDLDGCVALYVRVMEAEGSVTAWAHLSSEQAVVLAHALLQGAEVARRLREKTM